MHRRGRPARRLTAWGRFRPPGLAGLLRRLRWDAGGPCRAGSVRCAPERERTFPTPTYLSPILLGVEVRRMGERYVHVGKVRSRSGAGRPDAARCARPGGRRGWCAARTPRPPAPPALRTPRRRPQCSPTPTCRPSRPAHTPPPLSARSWSGSRSVRGTVRAPAVVRGSPGTRKTDLLPPRGAVSPRDHSSSAAESGRARSPSSACSPCAPALPFSSY